MNKQMTYEQISDILKTVDSYHEQVKTQCEFANWEARDKQKQILLESLVADQEKIQSAQAYYQDQSSDGEGTKPWIQYIPLQELEACVKEIKQTSSTDIEAFVSSVIDFHRYTYELFMRLKEQASSEESSEVLNDLAEIENENAKKITKRLAGLRDV